MHQMLANTRWMKAFLCAGALLVTPLLAFAAGTPVSLNGAGPSLSARTVGSDGESHEPSYAYPLFERTVEWWPYATGPNYGSLSAVEETESDAIRLLVGSFRAGDRLDVPVELTASLRGLSQGMAQYFLVQLQAGDDPGASREVITSLGAVVVEEVPVNALIVRLDRAAYDRVAASPAITFIEPFHPAFRIHPGIGGAKQLTPEAAASPIFDLVLNIFPGEPLPAVTGILQKINGVTVKQVFDTERPKIFLSAPASLIPQLAQLEPVALVHEAGHVLPHAARGSVFLQSPGGLRGDFPYWQVGLDGDGQIIEVTDSGLSVDAADHANTRASSGWTGTGGNNGPNVAAGHRKVVTYRTSSVAGGTGDLGACDSILSGAFSHGQVVSGVALGNATRDTVPAPSQPSPGAGFGNGFYDDNNNDGRFDEINDDGFDGIAKGAKVVFVDANNACPDQLNPTLSVGNLNTLITQTWTQHRANIHNFSFGSTALPTGPSYAAGGDDIDAAVIANRINFVAISAGNDGDPSTSANSTGVQGNEASCKNCVAVGASNGVAGSTWNFTSGGFGPDRRVLTLLFAEGGDNSCRSEDAGESPGENQTGVATCVDGGTQLGTSFAAPNLAGAAAVVRDYFAKGFYPDGTNTNPTNNTELVPTISANLIKALLVIGAQPLTDGKVVTPVDRFNYYWGYGRIQLNNSLPLAQFPTKSISGIIVHDQPGDIDGNGGADGVSSLSLPSTLATTLTSYTDEFEVLDNTEDLVASISWHDPVNSNGFVTNDVDLRIRYCGADANCTTPGDDIVWRGNIFSEDFDRNGTTNNDLNGNGQIDGYFYTIEQRTGMDTWRDNKNNVEAVFIPSIFNAVDKDNDGTDDVARLRTGQYRIEVERRSGSTVLNYAVAIGGPVTAGSSVRFDSNPLTCNADVSVLVNELEDGGDAQCPNTGNCPDSVIENRVTVQVLDAANVVVDTETGLDFTRTATGLRFESARLPLSVTQPLGNDDGVLTVDDGHSLKVTYTDSSSTRSSVAAVDCRPDVELQFISQIDEDFPFLLGGGCDRDKFLDVGENFSMQIEYFNLDAIDLVDGEVSLKAVVPFPDGTPQATIDADPCRNTRPASPYIRVDNPVNQFALLPSQTAQRTNFVFEVVGTPPQRDVVELVLSLAGPKTGQPVEDCVAFEFLMQADEQINRYITDCPTGCTVNYDLNLDEKLENSIARNPFDPIDFLNRGSDETSVVFGNLTDTSFRTVDSDGDGTPDCALCGNPGFNGPWNFDVDNEGFRSGVSPRSAFAPATTQITNWGEDRNWDGVLQSPEDANFNSVLNQNWGLGGGCGFVTATGSSRGIWHTGTIGTWVAGHRTSVCRPNDNICEQYDTQTGTTGQEFWFESLRSPVVRPVRSGIDPDGFSWRTQIVDWAFNMQLELADENVLFTWEFDPDTNSANPLVLGDEFIGGFISNSPLGAVNGGQITNYGGAWLFNPTITNPSDANYGDELLGSKGNNRTAARGCFFNDLDLIDTGDGLTAAERPINAPKPEDDDCDNDFNLVDGCPGDCGVDDDNNGIVDDVGEICPCKVCAAGSPRAGQSCRNAQQCNISISTSFQCVANTNAAGVPTGFGDDVCGDGQTDENVNADFGTQATSLLQRRNFDISAGNGVGDTGRGAGDPRFNTLEDLYGPEGQAWQGEVGLLVSEPEGSTAAVPSYGIGIDDMVLQWKEVHPIGQTVATCSVANPQYEGTCAQLALGVAFNTNDGDGEIEVSVIDFNAASTENAVDCNGDSQALEVEVEAFSEAERIPETYCLEQASPGSKQYRGVIKTTTRVNQAGDGLVYLAFNGSDTPSVTARYLDKNDGLNGFNNGPDGQPGVAGVDDDDDGTVDNASELCPVETSLGPGRSPHIPGTAVRYSDDNCGCLDNPIADSTFAAFDPAGVILVSHDVDDSACTGCDNDGFADPGEQVKINVTIRNQGDFPLVNVELSAFTTSNLVECLTDDRIVIDRLEKRGEPGDEFTTSVDSFSFVAARGINRGAAGDKFGSEWTLGLRALGKAEPTSSLQFDVPISSTLVVQSFFVPHNLSAPATTAIANYSETFESYSNSAALRTAFPVRVTGDTAAELDGTRCQANDPANPQGNNTDPLDFCELGQGFNNSEEHWHLSAPSAVGGTVCDGRATCPDGGRSMPGGTKSVSNANHVDADGSVLDDFHTQDYNRMNWIQTGQNFQLGLGTPEFEYWTQLSILDERLFGGGGFAFDAALNYICVDKNNNNECDTGQQPGGANNGEFWEPIRSAFSPENTFRLNNFINCMFDPSDDSTTEDQFFPNSGTQGPSSTCFPGNPVMTCVGRTREDDTGFGIAATVLTSLCWPETGTEDAEIGEAGAVKGFGGDPGTWVRKTFRLEPWRGQKVLFRWHQSPGGLPGIENGAGFAAWQFGNRDDGWWIDNVAVRGLVNDFNLTLDNDGPVVNTCATTANCTSVNSVVAVLPYPRNDRNGLPKPAIYCTSQTTAECDFDENGVVDTSATLAQSDAPGRAFYIDARFSDADRCLGGAIEYRLLDLTSGTVVRDWVTDPLVLVNPSTTTSYRVETRCSSDFGCSDAADFVIDVPGSGPVDCRTSSLVLATNKQNITWAASPQGACPALFDTLRGTTTATGSGFTSGTCLENDGADTSSLDAGTPSLGTAFWYLARHAGDTYATGSAGEQDRSGITGCP